MITPEEFLKQMQGIKQYNHDNPEVTHINADNLMANTLTELGYGDGVKIFSEMWKWYS